VAALGNGIERLRAERALARQALRETHPALFPKSPTPSAPVERSAIVLGRNERDEAVKVPLKARLEHTHVVGTTGGGKTKLLEHQVQQDIIDGRGVCVVDPHGNHPDSLYRSLLSWLDVRGYTKTRTIHLIDPNAASHVTGLDPLALPSPDYDCTVIAEAMQEALERVWGEEDMNSKPTMQRVLAAVLTALTELRLTLAEARLLFDPHDRQGIRAWAIGNLKDQEAREELAWLHDMAAEPRGRQDFRQEVTGPRNRLSKLTRVDAIRTMVGQQERTLDFRCALDEGHVILANLSPGPRASDKAAQLLGRLLTRMLFFHAVRREHPERPFFFYLDECQLYLSGDVSRLLAEARKYGVGCVLSHQFLAQFELAGLDVLEAVKNTTNIKVVLRIKNPEEAAALADMVLRYDLEMPVRALIKPTVVGHQLAKLKGESVSDQFAVTKMRTDSHGRSVTESFGYAESVAETIGESISTAESEASSSAEVASNASINGDGTGMSTSDMMAPGGGFSSTPNLVGMSQSQSAQSHSSQVAGTSSMRGSSSASSSSKTTSKATATASSWSEGIAYTTSSAMSLGRAETRGQAQTRGTQEAFESIYEDRPNAVHGLENIRYMAAQLLRNLTAGRAALNFVDATGMKSAALKVAYVASHALPPAEFDALRERILDMSPSSCTINIARENVAARERRLIEQARVREEPETVMGFRHKKMRAPKSTGAAMTLVKRELE
jgi:type IV secretion system coupling TraD/TrwB family protein